MRKLIGHELKIISNLIRRRMDNAPELKDANRLTGMHGWVIGFIHNNKDRDVFQRDLESECNVRRSTATSMLQIMEGNGLIVRQAVPYDARLKKLVLTEKAKDLHQTIVAEIEKMEQQLLTGIDEAEINTFFKTLDKLKKNLE